MKRILNLLILISIFWTFSSFAMFALNPFITAVYTADPSAHVFEGRVYVYPSHDKDNPGWFDMEDYHVFSTADMTNWVDHGVVITWKDIPWVLTPTSNPTGENGTYAQNDAHPRLWAPDCAFKNSTYYLYIPATDKDGNFKIGVATSQNQSPVGPFISESDPISGSSSVDPCVFVDDDGQAYMFYGGQGSGGRDGHGPLWVKLKGNMKEFDGTPQEIPTSQVQYWFEASWVFKRNNTYYLTYSTGGNLTDSTHPDSQIAYATSNDIRGPWTYRGVAIGDVTGWTNHQSFVQFQGDWYAFYHTCDLSGPDSSGNYNIGKRSICVDKLNFNNDGTMQTVATTREGVGTSAYSRIKAMLFSGQSGVETSQDCGGGDIGKCVSYIENNDYIYFNNVTFSILGTSGFEAQVASDNYGGTIEVRDGSPSGDLLGTLTVNNTGGWNNWATVKCDLSLSGGTMNSKKNIYLVFKGGSGYLFNLNWFKFDRSLNIPAGYSAAFKSLNDQCYVNGNPQYLCVDDSYNKDLCANRSAVGGAWERFSIIDYATQWRGTPHVIINSSNNGKNLFVNSSNSTINASGGNYKSYGGSDLYLWSGNDDGTISLYTEVLNKYLCVASDLGTNPAKVYANRTSVANWEKFYCEVSDAPIGCVVAFKSQNPNCIDNSGNQGQKYLCIDNNNYGNLCVNRNAVGGDWEKFLVVDANNGYIALKSFNGNQYLRFTDTNNPGQANGTKIDDNSRFQWKNNGDGTISLFNIATQQYLCADTTNGKSNNPAKVYADRPSVGKNDQGISWEKFYCQIVK
jgi:hypothetical protein